MNWKLWLCIGMGVLVAHLMVILVISRVRELGQPPPPRPKPQELPFSTVQYHYVDENKKVVKVVQEFKVSTEFAKPEVLEKLPPPPWAKNTPPTAAPVPSAGPNPASAPASATPATAR